MQIGIERNRWCAYLLFNEENLLYWLTLQYILSNGTLRLSSGGKAFFLGGSNYIGDMGTGHITLVVEFGH
jgi:hypothetical protein